MQPEATQEYQLVESQKDFEVLCERLSHNTVLALDTEFVRTRTLLPQLGLLQVNDGDSTYLIDPIHLEDLTPFAQLLANESIVKVLHACSEDLEVFQSHLKVTPSPIFDTQFAANVLGMGPTLGYAKLVELICNTQIDKGESRTDWLARPLTNKQLHYAANDVIYLFQCYSDLAMKIDANNQRAMIYQELAVLAAKKAAMVPADYAYLTFGNVWKLNEQQRYVLKRLAAWRLTLARETNTAINFIVKEQHLLSVAMHLPRSKSKLSGLRVLLPQEIRKRGDQLIGIVNQAINAYNTNPDACAVPRVKRLADIPAYKKELAGLKALCQQIATEHAIAVELLASKKQLNQLLKWWWFELDETAVTGMLPDLLMGWRRPLFKQSLLSQLGKPIREIE
ncbi:ribonuclease D [Alteromonas sp. ASW11-36]|uniref:Ribonuclease D n=1 Tax=Alteromonas arenosi TaxID=3055817 RepID=A0ABT7SVS0_9ALTE|nr:ribonuclease D [Alteromonas sp. ASW11-36]MDM7860289.1 ribonuclease D [Alteromonas sp. ASW11-36]